MEIQRVRFLRELLSMDKNSKTTVTMEFSYDHPRDREPRFFGVPIGELAQARQLYSEWGGKRPEGYRRGSTAVKSVIDRPRKA